MKDKTLIVGPAWVGDMVMAQALFRTIKSRYPNTLIDVLAPEWSRPLTDRMPEINTSIVLPLKHGELGLATRYKIGKSLIGQYQRCFVLPNSFKSALIPFWANIPTRIGWRGEWRYSLLNKMRILNKRLYPLMVQRYIALAYEVFESLPQKLLKPKLVANQENLQNALTRYQLSLEKPILILCPGAEFGPSKRWPTEYYAEVANHFISNGYQIWIIGSSKERDIAQHIQSLTEQQSIDLTGKTTLADAIDLMSQATLVVTNDSGLMHIAAALQRCVIAVYGSTDPGFTPPLSQRAVILREKLSCSPCFKRECPLKHHDCMKKLSAQKVILAAEKLVRA